MKIKRTSNAEHRTPNAERNRGGLGSIFDVASRSLFSLDVRCSMFDVRCFRSSRPASRVSRHPSPATRHSQNGVALVITLILLSVVTFMAITFLAVSRRERGAVTTVTDTATARFAADAALANAEAQIMANVLATTNPFNFGLLVSTNYINPNGFVINSASPTNVNYDHEYNSSTLLTPADFLQNLANLYYSPRPPVFISTNPSSPLDFRFYLDLNRNGRDDPNGVVINVVDNAGNSNGVISEVGDPEWIGVLQRPDQPYGPNNPFVARYAFIAVPVGNTLDLNAIHNQAHRGLPSLPGDPTVNPPANNLSTPDSFIRNEGVGSWEINLAAFLADLNTNEWDNYNNSSGYQYPQPNLGNSSAAFNDARALLAYRYNNNFNTLSGIGASPKLFGTSGVNAFSFDNIDDFSYGFPLMTGFQLPGENDSTLIANQTPWAGADNTNHFFTHQELFDSTKVQNPNAPPAFGFTDRLLNASTNQWGGTTVSTYDRYTFYRLLSQLGTDSTPDSGKMNLNYDNLTPYIFVGGVPVVSPNGVASATNFVTWQPLTFFTNAADRLLRTYTAFWRNSNPTNFATTFYAVSNFNFINPDQWTNYPAFGIGNIPVLVNNKFVYSSAVNRLLQLAANIYDSTTNRYYDTGFNAIPLPTVFQPVFGKVPNGLSYDVYITNFFENTNLTMGADLFNHLPLDLNDPTDLASLLPTNLVYGVPIIIGAKKGLPNFNEFEMESTFQIERKLQFTRTGISGAGVLGPSEKINQMYRLGINNLLGVECWNSYRSSYTRQTTLAAMDKIQMVLTNDEGAYYSLPPNTLLSGAIVTNNWPGTGTGKIPSPRSFLIPFNTNEVFLPDSTYLFSTHNFTTNSTAYESNVVSYLQPHWGLITTNNLQVVLIDTLTGRAIDYVQLRGPSYSRDLISEIQDPDGARGYVGLWATNNNGSGIPWGIVNQRDIALGNYGTAGSTDYGRWSPGNVASEIASFRSFYLGGSQSYTDPLDPTGTKYVTNNTLLSVQVPFTAARISIYYISWQANDPLVHYLASDLNYFGKDNDLTVGVNRWALTAPLPQLINNNLGILNDRYLPWDGNPNRIPNPTAPSPDDKNIYNKALKDSLMSRSDNWDFPTNKFPTVGWLGRVHRGTPWQTVYLKATDVAVTDPGYWATNWTGDVNLFDANNAAPAQDRLLFDLFTTAFNDNASRGKLSVNQNHLAAWSALFSGIVVPTNLIGVYTVINPAGSAGAPAPVGPPPSPNSPLCLGYLVQNGTNGINDIRAKFVNADGLKGSFEHVGDILAVPALTAQSPFLVGQDFTNGVSDELMEWLPQQTMSLLRCSSSPRYVIYCYGQALKPAPNGIYSGGGAFFGMITNYQVVSEIATRAVVQFGSTLTNTVSFWTTNIAGNTITNWFSQPMVTNNNAVIQQFNILPPD